MANEMREVCEEVDKNALFDTSQATFVQYDKIVYANLWNHVVFEQTNRQYKSIYNANLR